jgi:hypothetical protein
MVWRGFRGVGYLFQLEIFFSRSLSKRKLEKGEVSLLQKKKV